MRTGWKATHIAIAGFVMPYMAVYSPALMLQASTPGAGVDPLAVRVRHRQGVARDRPVGRRGDRVPARPARTSSSVPSRSPRPRCWSPRCQLTDEAGLRGQRRVRALALAARAPRASGRGVDAPAAAGEPRCAGRRLPATSATATPLTLRPPPADLPYAMDPSACSSPASFAPRWRRPISRSPGRTRCEDALGRALRRRGRRLDAGQRPDARAPAPAWSRRRGDAARRRADVAPADRGARARADPLRLYLRPRRCCWRDGCRALGELVGTTDDGAVVTVRPATAAAATP